MIHYNKGTNGCVNLERLNYLKLTIMDSIKKRKKRNREMIKPKEGEIVNEDCYLNKYSC